MSPLMLFRLARYAWASPDTAAGLLVAAAVLARGGTIRRRAGVLEVFLPASPREWFSRFGAITLGHVILARSARVLDLLRAHEMEHVRQYERWGPAFFPAYAASSVYQLLRGRPPYWCNWFEVQARERCGY